ncbi:MAG: N-acetylglucosaminyl-phosphatidylinositol de-N-acetylase [Claussenomyces sp. TS43310]|nr:MAG: N-acetylglucosaminyl-phosphatidylinositol de-N-acetylase [Claussenomyces sp. TS43310]
MLPWVTWLTLPLVLVTSWLLTINVVRDRLPKLRNKRVCLLIAHPDDEAMFFAPAILALTDPRLGNHVKILCLSSGDADGLGETRKKELIKSGMLLGLRKEDDVFIVESPDFQDSMTSTWSKEKIADLLSSAFAPSLKTHKAETRDAPTATIDVLITFDAGGISSHPNHISLYHGARHFISSLVRNRPGWQCPVDLYTLSTINITRKYSSFLDSFASLLLTAFGRRAAGVHPSPLIFVSGPADIRTAQNAMTKAHISQMRWFRWGWIGLSRYMAVNDLQLEKVP